MTLRPFIKIQNLAYDLSKVQSNVAAFVQQLINIPYLKGAELTEVSIGTSETVVEHTLNRDYRGWIVTNIDTNTNVWVSSSTEKSKYLKLQAGSACTISLWVF